MAFLTINGVPMPAPSELKMELLNIGSDEQRSASGRLVCDRVAVKKRLKLKWAVLSGADIARLFSAADGFFTASCPDPCENAAVNAEFYASAKSLGVMRMNGDECVWEDAAMEWTER